MTKNPDSFLPIPEISFFCPAYNDEKNLPKLIPTVHEFLSRISKKFEILIIEDGSPDKTGEVAEQLAKKFSNIKVINHPYNMGYGATLRDGFRQTRYSYVMYTDGDSQYDIQEFEPYLNLLDKADVLAGYVRKKAVTPRRKFQSWVYNALIKILFFVNFHDVNCAMKIYSRKVLDIIDIKSASAFIDAEMMIGAKRNGFKIAQFPVTHFERLSGLASGSRFSVIAETFKDMIKFRFGLL